MVKLSLKQVRFGIIVVALMIISGGIGWNLGRRNSFKVYVPSNKNSVDMGLYWQVWDKLHEAYLIKDNLKTQEMTWGAIKGMTAALGDPYTVFLPPVQNKATQEELNGAFEGVGIQLGFKDNQLAVIAPLVGTPAEAAGVKAGDFILKIKDEKKGVDRDTGEITLPEAVELIRGPKGTEVTLTILRSGDSETKEVMMARDTIVVKSVELSWVGEDKKVALLKLTRFGGRTETEWEEAVKEINSQKAKGVILDLRNNPGGYLQGAVRYAGEFLPRGKVVVQQKNSQDKVESYSVDFNGKLLKEPLVVLVNQGSASSSEILAGVLRDYKRAKLVGEKTFGKGTIQEALDLGEGAGLHVTTAKWLLPLGQWVNETKGIAPDEEVKNDPEKPEEDLQLEKALEIVLQ
ncbi:MAG: S41 family peptidase [Patescibacteria group bacterium]